MTLPASLLNCLIRRQESGYANDRLRRCSRFVLYFRSQLRVYLHTLVPLRTNGRERGSLRFEGQYSTPPS